MEALVLSGRSCRVTHTKDEVPATAEKPARTFEEFLLTVSTEHGMVECVLPETLVQQLGADMGRLDQFGQLVEAVVEPATRVDKKSFKRVGCVKALDVRCVDERSSNGLQAVGTEG